MFGTICCATFSNCCLSWVGWGWGTGWRGWKVCCKCCFWYDETCGWDEDLVPFGFTAVEYGVLRWSVGMAWDLLEQL